MKAIILGVDGVSWGLVQPLIAKGLMPNFKRIIDKGGHGTLRSVIPPVTAPAWVSFATGTHPGKHSIFNFVLPGKSLEDLQTVTSKNIQSETFYEILDRNGLKSTLINLPGTYPPRIDAPVITSLMTRGDNPVFPVSLLEEVPELRDYRIVPNMSLLFEGKLGELVDDIRDLERHRFICAQKLFEKGWDLFFLMFSGVDWVQHFFPEFLDGKSSRDEEMSKAEQLLAEIDGYFGWFMDRISDDTALFALSDHGFKMFLDTFQVNVWLQREGFLNTRVVAESSEVSPHKVFEETMRAQKERMEQAEMAWETKRRQELEELRERENQSAKRRFFLPAKVVDGLRRTGLPQSALYRWAKRILGLKVQKPSQIVDVEAVLESERLGRRKRMKISAAGTRAACVSYESAGIYINKSGKFTDGVVDGEEYEQLRTDLMQQLATLKHPVSGKPVFAAVLGKEEAYWGPHLESAPDIVLLRGDFEVGAVLEGELFNGDKVPGHSSAGIVMAFGKDIAGTEVKDANIVDVVPTVLHFLGMAVPKNMDGRVLVDMFSEGSRPRKKPAAYEDSEALRLRRKLKRAVESGKI